MDKVIVKKEKRVSPRFVIEGLAEYDENGQITGLKEGSKQWAHDEYASWLLREGARKNSAIK